MNNKLYFKESTCKTFVIECSRVIATSPRPITSPLELSPNMIFSFEFIVGEYDENILFSPII
jgi:hypothetical protein